MKTNPPYPHRNSVAFVHRSHLRKNFQTVSTVSGGQRIIAMVKANAYGHGIQETVKVLAGLPASLGLWGFGVANLQEAVELRMHHKKFPVLVFSETWTQATRGLEFCEKYDITPVLHDPKDVLAWQAKIKSSGSFVRPHLKLNTGLERLGIDAKDYLEILPKIEWDFFGGLLTHFSAAEKLDRHAFEQARLFKELVLISGLKVRQKASSFLIHAFATGGLPLSKKLKLNEICNAVRPGIALYGYAPQWESHGLKRKGFQAGLKPVLEWRVFVRKVRTLLPGDLVGYDATFEVKKRLNQALLSVGYADGFFRQLSNQEIYVGLGERPRTLTKARVLGRVSMDLVSLGVKSKIIPSSITLLGITAEQGLEFASRAQTIIYEVLTSLSNRVPRVYR